MDIIVLLHFHVTSGTVVLYQHHRQCVMHVLVFMSVAQVRVIFGGENFEKMSLVDWPVDECAEHFLSDWSENKP